MLSKKYTISATFFRINTASDIRKRLERVIISLLGLDDAVPVSETTSKQPDHEYPEVLSDVVSG